MSPDETKSLTQLTGTDWGSAPADAKTLVRESHEFRRTPLQDLPTLALKRLLSLDFQSDSTHLIPYCLKRIAEEPSAGIPLPHFSPRRPAPA